MTKLFSNISHNDLVLVRRKLDGWRPDQTNCGYFPKDNLKGWRLYIGEGLPSDDKPLLGGHGYPCYCNHPETDSKNDEVLYAFFVDKNDNCQEYCVVYEQLISAIDEASKVREIYNRRLNK